MALCLGCLDTMKAGGDSPGHPSVRSKRSRTLFVGIPGLPIPISSLDVLVTARAMLDLAVSLRGSASQLDDTSALARQLDDVNCPRTTLLRLVSLDDLSWDEYRVPAAIAHSPSERRTEAEPGPGRALPMWPKRACPRWFFVHPRHEQSASLFFRSRGNRECLLS